MKPIRFRSSASGLWYENPNAAGDIDAVNDNGAIIVRNEEDTNLQWMIRVTEWRVKRDEARNPSPKPPRICVVCGARVTNTNPVTTTCSEACTVARDHNISRERAMRLLPAHATRPSSQHRNTILDRFINPR